MAVQQNKKSRSRKGMRRSHDRVAVPSIRFCTCGEPTVPYAVCPKCGKYGDHGIEIRIKTKKTAQQ